MLLKDFDKTQTTLVFETLDGVAQVLVDGKQVAATANSFVPYRIEVKDVLVTGEPDPSAF
jgi:beta-galactosidase/beta-glucuronidase